MRTINYIWIFFSLFPRIRNYSTVILTRLISKSLNLFLIITFSICLSLINPTSSGNNSFLFIFIIWFVINGQIHAEVSSIITHDCSTIPNINNKHSFLNQKSNNGTGPTLIKHMIPTLRKSFNSIKEIRFRLLISIYNSLPGVLGKRLIFDNKLMQIIP